MQCRNGWYVCFAKYMESGRRRRCLRPCLRRVRLRSGWMSGWVWTSKSRYLDKCGKRESVWNSIRILLMLIVFLMWMVLQMRRDLKTAHIMCKTSVRCWCLRLPESAKECIYWICAQRQAGKVCMRQKSFVELDWLNRGI